MKKNIFYFLITLLFLPACKKDTPVEIDFKLSAETGKAPMKISITNNTKGADTYLWTFEGGDPGSSKEKHPTVVFYNSGSYSINLEAIGNDTKIASKTIILSTSNKELITNKKWQFISFITYQNYNDDTLNLYNHIAESYNEDNFYYFFDNSSFEINLGEMKKPSDTTQIDDSGTWSFNDMQTILSLSNGDVWHEVNVLENYLKAKRYFVSDDKKDTIFDEFIFQNMN